MGAKRRQFTLEFKLEAVRLANTSDKPVSQVAQELGIRPEMCIAHQLRGSPDLLLIVSEALVQF